MSTEAVSVVQACQSLPTTCHSTLPLHLSSSVNDADNAHHSRCNMHGFTTPSSPTLHKHGSPNSTKMQARKDRLAAVRAAVLQKLDGSQQAFDDMHRFYEDHLLQVLNAGPGHAKKPLQKEELERRFGDHALTACVMMEQLVFLESLCAADMRKHGFHVDTHLHAHTDKHHAPAESGDMTTTGPASGSKENVTHPHQASSHTHPHSQIHTQTHAETHSADTSKPAPHVHLHHPHHKHADCGAERHADAHAHAHARTTHTHVCNGHPHGHMSGAAVVAAHALAHKTRSDHRVGGCGATAQHKPKDR